MKPCRLFFLGLVLISSTQLWAQQGFPNKPIRMIIGYPPGGPLDTTTRMIANDMSNELGQQVIVENRSGASDQIATDYVAKSSPDGHTLLLWHIGMASTPGLYRKLQYKPLEDFEYLGLVNEVPMTLIGKPQLAANTYRDFENYIKANAGKRGA